MGEDACKETSEQRPLSKIKNSNFSNKKTKNLIKTWDRDFKIHFSKDTQVTKKMLGILSLRNFKLKQWGITTKIQNTDNTKYLEGSVQKEVSFSVVRNAERDWGYGDATSDPSTHPYEKAVLLEGFPQSTHVINPNSIHRSTAVVRLRKIFFKKKRRWLVRR